MIGNRLTGPARAADNAKELIARAILEVEDKHGWVADTKKILFSGVYYDSEKVGSYIVKAKNREGKQGVLKLQLRELPHDEGLIVRHIQNHNKSTKIYLPKIFIDRKWNSKIGYGLLVFEDLSAVPHFWGDEYPISDHARQNYKVFLHEFLHNVLPIPSWFQKSTKTYKELYMDAFNHFSDLAQHSRHQHVDKKLVDAIIKLHFDIFNNIKFSDMHFTHGHLSGLDIRYDAKRDRYFLFSNLLWSYRPKYYELTFPMWVDIMHIRNRNLEFQDFLDVILGWSSQWKDGLYEEDPTKSDEYWFSLLSRAGLTIILDLGASEWKKEEVKEKEVLLERWKDFFNWIIGNKF